MPPHAPPTNGSIPHGSPPNGSDTRRSLRFIHALIDQARRWTSHALASSKLDPAYVTEKALAAIVFTLRFVGQGGTPPYDEAEPYDDAPYQDRPRGGSEPQGTIVLSIPTKLVGVKAVQPNVRSLKNEILHCAMPLGLQLGVRTTPSGLLVYWQDRAIGRIQDKHAPWLAPLLPAHVSVHLIGVTGDEAKGHTLGVNVCIRLHAGL